MIPKCRQYVREQGRRKGMEKSISRVRDSKTVEEVCKVLMLHYLGAGIVFLSLFTQLRCFIQDSEALQQTR